MNYFLLLLDDLLWSLKTGILKGHIMVVYYKTNLDCKSACNAVHYVDKEHKKVDFHIFRDAAQSTRDIGWWKLLQSGGSLSLFEMVSQLLTKYIVSNT